MKRKVFTVTPIKHPTYAWVVRVSDTPPSTIGWYLTKAEAVENARDKARQWRRLCGLSQLRIKGRDGKLQTEHTYGADPRRYKG